MAGEMTPRERVLTAMRRCVPDRVPADLSWGLTPGLLARFRRETGAASPEDHFRVDVRFAGLELDKGWGATPDVDDEGSLDPARADKEAAFRRYLGELPDGAAITEWGVGHLRGSEAHFVRFVHPLRAVETAAEIAAYPWPTFDEPWRLARLRRAVAGYHARDLAVGGMAAATIFETSWQLRGLETLLEDLYLRPGLAEALLERVTELRCASVRALVEAGSDVLVLGDDVAAQRGMMVSPAAWRRWLRPRLARVIAAAREVRPDVLIFYHTDGDARAIIDDLIEIGVDILNPVQPECMDPAALKVAYGDRLAFWGTIGCQTTLPFCTPQEVKDEVRRRIETVGPGGGLLIGPTHSPEPEVPIANLEALYEAVEQYGKYR